MKPPALGTLFVYGRKIDVLGMQKPRTLPSAAPATGNDDVWEVAVNCNARDLEEIALSKGQPVHLHLPDGFVIDCDVVRFRAFSTPHVFELRFRRRAA